MLIRGQFWQVSRVHRNPLGHRGQPGENQRHSFNPFLEERQGGSKANGKDGSLEQVHLQTLRQVSRLFRNSQESKGFPVDGKMRIRSSKAKSYLTTPPLMSKPLLGEVLLLYLAVSEHTVSAVLVREEGNKQLPIYYVRKALLDGDPL